jgi:hypothetical protein|tara:strand:+ start:34 stop:300 length:267 start_codon:yes stop_codon:yes gene_type:complete
MLNNKTQGQRPKDAVVIFSLKIGYNYILRAVRESTKPISLNEIYLPLHKSGYSKRNIKKLLDKAIKKGVIKLVSKDLYARKDLDLLSL